MPLRMRVLTSAIAVVGASLSWSSSSAFIPPSSTLVGIGHTCWKCPGVTQARHERQSGVYMMAKGNRKARRMADAKKKKSGSSGPREPTRTASDAKWLQVLDAASELESGTVKVVSTKYKGDDKFFALAKHGGKFFATSEGCGRCKFPMINGQVKVLVGGGQVEDVKEEREQDPDAAVGVACPLCGAVFDMSTGAITGEQPKGLLPSFVSKLMSTSVVESVKPYQARALGSGALVVRVD